MIAYLPAEVIDFLISVVDDDCGRFDAKEKEIAAKVLSEIVEEPTATEKPPWAATIN